MSKAPKKVNKVVEILMSRDGYTQTEAEHILSRVREMLYEAAEAGDYGEAEEIMYSELGLEMDYLFDII